MMEQITIDSYDEDARDSHDEYVAPLLGSQVPVVRFEKLLPFTPTIDLVDGGAHLDSARWRC